MTQGLGLYYEHSFSSGPGVSAAQRADWEHDLQQHISDYVNTLGNDGLVRLGSLVPADPGTQQFVVFNPLSWMRTDFADLPADPSGSFYVVDQTTGLEVPSQEITTPDGPRVRISVTSVPSVGYKVYELRSGTRARRSPRRERHRQRARQRHLPGDSAGAASSPR
jgi:alpha-mannosidase